MDLTERLRASITQARAIDRSELLAEAANTVDRLNREVSVLVAECQRQKDLLVNGATLTEAERQAIKAAEKDYGDNDMDAKCWHMAATLRGLLERLG